MGVVHSLEHGQAAAHTGLEMTCGRSGTTERSVPGPTRGQALPVELPVWAMHRKAWLQARPDERRKKHD